MSDSAEQKYVPECYACPIGTASMALQGAAPDATQHLFAAGRELLTAFRGFLDGMDSFLQMMEERSRAADRGQQGIQAIPIRRGERK
jgi:hypothetical protein